MIFDYELMFIDDKDGAQKNVTSGVLGDVIDLSGKGQGKGFPGLIAIAITADTTAGGDPDIQFALESADNKDFEDCTVYPALFPTPFKKEDLTEGRVLSFPLPLIGLDRYVRLKIGTDSAITCLSVRAGFVLDAPLP